MRQPYNNNPYRGGTEMEDGVGRLLKVREETSGNYAKKVKFSVTKYLVSDQSIN